MSVKQIRLTEFQDVKEFVTAAERCDYDVDISYNRVVIDAKSLMGVLSLDLTMVLTVKYHEEYRDFEDMLSKNVV